MTVDLTVAAIAYYSDGDMSDAAEWLIALSDVRSLPEQAAPREPETDPVTIAGYWHGGQFSALYSYASTGEIHGPDHRDDLLSEISRCEPLTDDDAAELEWLRYTVECWPNEAI